MTYLALTRQEREDGYREMARRFYFQQLSDAEFRRLLSFAHTEGLLDGLLQDTLG